MPVKPWPNKSLSSPLTLMVATNLRMTICAKKSGRAIKRLRARSSLEELKLVK